MKFKEFSSNLNKALIGETIVSQSMRYDDVIKISESGVKYVNNKPCVNEESNLDKEFNNELIVNAINEYDSSIRITEDLLNAYKTLLENNSYTLDPVINSLKSTSINLDNKIEFTLNDGSIIAISEELQNTLIHVINKYEILDYMRESKENFMYVIDKIIEEQ